MIKIRSLEKAFGGKFVGGNKAEFYSSGQAAFDELLSELNHAKQSIYFGYYLFVDDLTGRRVAGLLKKKAIAGIDVRVIYDTFSSRKTHKRFWKKLRRAGVKTARAHPFQLSNPLSYIKRLHWKVVVIDGQTMFIGGRNMQKDYWQWKDVIIKLKGPVAVKIQSIFESNWTRWHGEKMPKMKHAEKIHKYKNGYDVMPIFSQSQHDRENVSRLLRHCIDHAEASIDVMTPFFVPPQSFITSLAEASKRGVRVRMLLPMKSNVPQVQYVAQGFFPYLMSNGVEIYRYLPRILHGKMYIFDQIFSIIGSVNLDFRSLWENDESNVGIYSRDFSRVAGGSYAEDLKKSERFVFGKWLASPFSKRFRARFYGLFRRRL